MDPVNVIFLTSLVVSAVDLIFQVIRVETASVSHRKSHRLMVSDYADHSLIL